MHGLLVPCLTLPPSRGTGLYFASAWLLATGTVSLPMNGHGWFETIPQRLRERSVAWHGVVWRSAAEAV